MECSECGGETRVIETTTYEDRVRRRRECQSCGGRFTTEEGRPEPDTFLTEEERARLEEAAGLVRGPIQELDKVGPLIRELEQRGVIAEGNYRKFRNGRAKAGDVLAALESEDNSSTATSESYASQDFWDDPHEEGLPEADEEAPITSRGKQVPMYLPPDLAHELEVAYKRARLEVAKKSDEPNPRFQKNRDFYPVVIRAGLDAITIEDVT